MIVTITGMDGSGKTTLIYDLLKAFSHPPPPKGNLRATSLHLPDSPFVNEALQISGAGTPMGDKHTDRLIFALDNRLAHYKLCDLLASYDIVFCQRGWMDSFIHGAVQGYNYEQTAALTHANDLMAPVCSIYLNCDPAIAYERIANDPLADKFETLDYMKEQHNETRAFYDALAYNNVLKDIFSESRIYIDTTDLTTRETFTQAYDFINSCISNPQ